MSRAQREMICIMHAIRRLHATFGVHASLSGPRLPYFNENWFQSRPKMTHCTPAPLYRYTIARSSHCTIASLHKSIRPGGMRGAVESAALVVDRSWRVGPKAQVQNRPSQICRSLTPLKSPPSGLAHSARPPKSHRRADFVIFKKQWPVPSQMILND